MKKFRLSGIFHIFVHLSLGGERQTMNSQTQLLQTKLIRLPDNIESEWPVRFRSLLPIWHPSVFVAPRRLNGVIIGTSEEDVFRLLQDIEYSRKNPVNIDASVQIYRDKQAFYEHNKLLQLQLGKPCDVCAEKLDYTDTGNQLDYSCYNGCVFHQICVSEATVCPRCNKKYINY